MPSNQNFGLASADVTEIHVTICKINLDPHWPAWQATHHVAFNPDGVIVNSGSAWQVIAVHIMDPDFNA